MTKREIERIKKLLEQQTTNLKLLENDDKDTEFVIYWFDFPYDDEDDDKWRPRIPKKPTPLGVSN